MSSSMVCTIENQTSGKPARKDRNCIHRLKSRFNRVFHKKAPPVKGSSDNSGVQSLNDLTTENEDLNGRGRLDRSHDDGQPEKRRSTSTEHVPGSIHSNTNVQSKTNFKNVLSAKLQNRSLMVATKEVATHHDDSSDRVIVSSAVSKSSGVSALNGEYVKLNTADSPKALGDADHSIVMINSAEAGAKHKLALARLRNRRPPTNYTSPVVAQSSDSVGNVELHDFFSISTVEPSVHQKSSSLNHLDEDVGHSAVDLNSLVLPSSPLEVTTDNVGQEPNDFDLSIPSRSVSRNTVPSLRLSSISTSSDHEATGQPPVLYSPSSGTNHTSVHRIQGRTLSTSECEFDSSTSSPVKFPKVSERPSSVMYPRSPVSSLSHSSPLLNNNTDRPSNFSNDATPSHLPDPTRPPTAELVTAYGLEQSAVANNELPSSEISSSAVTYSIYSPSTAECATVSVNSSNVTDASISSANGMKDDLKPRVHLRPVPFRKPVVTQQEDAEDIGSVSNRASVFGAVLRPTKLRPLDRSSPPQERSTTQSTCVTDPKRRSKVLDLVKNFDINL